MTVPYRADQVGSFLRPAALLEARNDGRRPGRSACGSWRTARSWSARPQSDLGFEIFTDGELRRSNFMSDFWDAVEGSTTETPWPACGRLAPGPPPRSAVTGIVTQKLRAAPTAHRARAAVHEAAQPRRDQGHAPSATQFPAIAYKRGISDRAYATRSALLWDVGKILKSECRPRRRGRVYIQIDAPRYSYYMDPKWREWIAAEMGQDPEPRWTRPSAWTTPASRPRGAPAYGRHPSLPREQPEPLVRGGRLRPDRREALHLAPGGPLPPRVRRRALRDVRAPPLRASRQGRRPRTGLEQGAELESPPSCGTHRAASRYVPLEAWRLAAVRLRLDHGGQSPHRSRSVGEARVDRADRPRGLALALPAGRADSGGALFSGGAVVYPAFIRGHRRGWCAPTMQDGAPPIGGTHGSRAYSALRDRFPPALWGLVFALLSIGLGGLASRRAEGADPTPGGTLVIGLDQEPPTLDPHASPSAVTYQIIASVTENLLYRGPRRQARALAGRVVDDRRGRAQRHLQAPPRREVPRRHPLQRRRGQVQLRPHRRSEVQGRRRPRRAGRATRARRCSTSTRCR